VVKNSDDFKLAGDNVCKFAFMATWRLRASLGKINVEEICWINWMESRQLVVRTTAIRSTLVSRENGVSGASELGAI